MVKGLITKKEIEINDDVSNVWNTLINPEMIKQYLSVTEAVSEWKIGSPIIFRGTWQGNVYEDKGLILKLETNKIFQYAYWTSFSGLDDKIENYSNITYELIGNGRNTLLGITQDNIKTAEMFNEVSKHLETVLKGLKEIVENQTDVLPL